MRIGNIKSKHIHEGIRFSAGYFLNEDALNSRRVESNIKQCKYLEEIADVWNPPIFKRQFCQNTERAVPYCQSSDVTNLLEGSEVFIFKKQAEKVNSIVKRNQILVTGFGTIGNTKVVNELSEGISFANNVCRIEANKDIPYGYIYAFLSSKYGKSQLNKNASGSVVRYIEAPGIKKTLIPIFPEEKQNEIHQLIVESGELRVEANKLLREAVDLFENSFPRGKQENIYKIGIDKIKEEMRFESTYGFKSINNFYKHFEINNYEIKTIKELSEKVFTPNIFKRVRTENPEFGIPFLSGSDLLQHNPKVKNYLSSKMKNIDDYILKEGWIAIQDAGTIGYVTFITSDLNGISATNNLVRVIPNENEFNYYIYGFLKSSMGQKLLRFMEYGSVQKHIDNSQVSNLRIPIIKDIFSDVSNKIKKSMKNIGNSANKENLAISLIEKEIDQWQLL